MSTVGILFCGAVLFVNALNLLGKIESKSAGVFNLFIGTMQIITPFYIIFTARGEQWEVFNAAGVFLFGLTFLYVGITNLKGYSGSGVGWYSLWVAILAVCFGLMSFIQNDVKFGLIWFMWSFLWVLFFLLLALGKDIAKPTGWVTLIQAAITTTIPAFLMLVGKWEYISNLLMTIVTGMFVGAVIFIFYKNRKGVSTSSLSEKLTGS
jgi:putative amide transporter protein